MPLFQVTVVLIVVGVLLWLGNTYLPMDPKVKRIANAVVIIALVLWLIGLFFGFGVLNHVRVGHVA
jgi:multisubunit Na+/H+ antiporter MnhB subunit